MSKIVEEYVAKKIAEAYNVEYNQAYEEAYAESKRKTNIKAIKSVMQKMHLSATEAMEALSIDETERNEYLTLL